MAHISGKSEGGGRQAISHLSDPDPSHVDSHVMDALCMEMLEIVSEAARVAQARLKRREALVERHFQLAHQSVTDLLVQQDKSSPEDASTKALDESLIRIRLESMGYRIGWCLAERLSRDKAPFPRQPQSASTPSQTPLNPEPIEVVKFICKDVWTTLHDKQIDNLRTNHRGVYVLQDNAYKPLLRLSGIAEQPASREAWVLRAQRALYMPCGIIRGSLACFGIQSIVTADLGGGTQCTFQIKESKT